VVGSRSASRLPDAAGRHLMPAGGPVVLEPPPCLSSSAAWAFLLRHWLVMAGVPTSASASSSPTLTSVNPPPPSHAALSSLVTGLVVLVVTLCFTGVFTNCPDNLTGAIMVSAVYRVLNPMEPLYCWKVSGSCTAGRWDRTAHGWYC